MTSRIAPEELAVRATLRSGMAHHDAGRLREAEAAYREVLESAPDRPDALVLLAGVEHATGRYEEALGHVERAIRIQPSVPSFHNLLGLVEQSRGRPREAEAAYRRALAIQPAFAAALFNLGNALRAQGRNEEALAAYRSALALDERPEYRASFARCVQVAPRLPGDPAFRGLVARAIAEAWIRPADLARAAGALLRGHPEPAREPLLLALLTHAQVCDPALERFITKARHDVLDLAAGVAPGNDRDLDFACALARQCFLNDYVLAFDEAEAARVGELCRSLEEALASEAPIPALRLAAIGAYLPLGSLAGADALAGRPAPEPLRALIVQQVIEPRIERENASRIPSLTEVRSEVSSAVRRQYEESPYPRWVACAPPEAATLETHLRGLFPQAKLELPARRDGLEILVAGCGTGQESAEIARRFPGSRVLAIDLSRASLAYARRKSDELGLANVEHAQADILELGDVGRRFDLISSVGVLHHLADPAAGWRRLLALLAPGGFMQVGLYSEAARRDIARARAFIAERGFEPTPGGIRAARAALLAAPDFAGVTSLRDFYGLNECRDLLFHVQEHRFTLPQVAQIAASLGLEWIGLAVDPGTRRRYAARFPGDPWASDAASWDAFEREFPDTFAGMYLFWLRKPAGR